ncbi:MAG: hypothetical protein M0Q91_15030 [Methanoregula sp.]|nr:hypothetical protein [Methanoregula sp.]
MAISHRARYPVLLISKELKIMKSYWCSQKNSMANLIKYKENFDPALVPCVRSECPRWDNGECIHLTKAGK